MEYCVSRVSNHLNETKSGDLAKQSRKRLMALRKGFSDKENEKQGLIYGLGICEVLP